MQDQLPGFIRTAEALQIKGLAAVNNNNNNIHAKPPDPRVSSYLGKNTYCHIDSEKEMRRKVNYYICCITSYRPFIYVTYAYIHTSHLFVYTHTEETKMKEWFNRGDVAKKIRERAWKRWRRRYSDRCLEYINAEMNVETSWEKEKELQEHN